MKIDNAPGNTIGGTTLGEGNLISGNTGNGVIIFGASAVGNVLLGNYIGTDAGGDANVGNTGDGVTINASANNNTVGGTMVGAGNVISWNGGSGILLDGGTANVVQGNLIGLNAAAMASEKTLSMESRSETEDSIRSEEQRSEPATSFRATSETASTPPVGGGFSLIEGNFIGTDLTGTIPLGNRLTGITLGSDQGTHIGGSEPGAGNLISGNRRGGIEIYTTIGPGSVIEGNRIGTDVTGTSALGNGTYGILLAGAVNHLVGGISGGAGNLISGNDIGGIHIVRPGNRIEGNIIGTNVAGTGPLANLGPGVEIDDTSDNTIGGTVAGSANLISGNAGSGIFIHGRGTNGNVIWGNRIGLDATGTSDLGNASDGVTITDSAGNVIGGTLVAARNVISGNDGHGVQIIANDHMIPSNNSVLGNLIGTDAKGLSAVGNSGDGVRLMDSVDNQIGGTTDSGARNVISGNLARGSASSAHSHRIIGFRVIRSAWTLSKWPSWGMPKVEFSSLGDADNFIGGTIENLGNIIAGNGTGVRVVGATGTVIRFNAFVENAGLGIDLGEVGVTPNDDPEADGLTNYPEITSVVANPEGGTIFTGSLIGTPGTTYTIDYYATPVADDSDHGEGRTFLSGLSFVMDSNGTFNFSNTLPVELTEHQYVTATATQDALGTSEFAANYEFSRADRQP